MLPNSIVLLIYRALPAPQRKHTNYLTVVVLMAKRDLKFAVALFRQNNSLAISWNFVIHPDSLQGNVMLYGIQRGGESIDDPWRNTHALRRLRNMPDLIGVFALQNGSKPYPLEVLDQYLRESHPANGCNAKPWGPAAWVAYVLVNLATDSVIKMPTHCMGSTTHMLTYIRARRALDMPSQSASGNIPIVALDPKASFTLPKPIQRPAASRTKMNLGRNPVQKKECRSAKEGEEDCPSSNPSSNPSTERKRVQKRDPVR
ncbi:hypothetical protein B0H34DRAFT_811319 [Crassisporium funariophilum]|nr:hypothetical protein B0H34DRAFT_811319 [Crassisporium funariophilum]